VYSTSVTQKNEKVCYSSWVAKEKTYGEVLNLRIDKALADEVARIASRREASESEVARMLLGWGVEAHRAMEAKELLRPYDAELPDGPLRMRVTVEWEEVDPEEYKR
jgi:hypothetical protein